MTTVKQKMQISNITESAQEVLETYEKIVDLLQDRTQDDISTIISNLILAIPGFWQLLGIINSKIFTVMIPDREATRFVFFNPDHIKIQQH